ncbi:UDP-N-acetylglucosamine 2-epimerase [Frankliniella fusca]|uniref:UDP-N-acetylglucosamine 2-epimerase n=1 Tax=Frankliniella fusca TaxID=407009 RepID=A0AAE1GWR8_9NEOP|nr:UDP-N-acetylglucosamine 2-epimerase [Frankliniella fusca]
MNDRNGIILLYRQRLLNEHALRGPRGPYCNPILNRRVSNLMNLLPAQIRKDLRVPVEALLRLMGRIIAQINPP